jgi:hypothetical protein
MLNYWSLETISGPSIDEKLAEHDEKLNGRTTVKAEVKRPTSSLIQRTLGI